MRVIRLKIIGANRDVRCACRNFQFSSKEGKGIALKRRGKKIKFSAIRLQDGSYLLNGNYSISWSGEYKAAGTTFVYLRQGPQNLESFSAAGPLKEPIAVMVSIVIRRVIPAKRFKRLISALQTNNK